MESKEYLIQDDLGHSLQSQIVPIPVPVLGLPGIVKVSYALLKVPKCEIFDLSDFHDVYITNSRWWAALW